MPPILLWLCVAALGIGGANWLYDAGWRAGDRLAGVLLRGASVLAFGLTLYGLFVGDALPNLWRLL